MAVSALRMQVQGYFVDDAGDGMQALVVSRVSLGVA